MSLHNIEYVSHPFLALLSNHQQQGTTEAATADLWAPPGYHNPHGRTIESRRSSSVLQGGCTMV